MNLVNNHIFSLPKEILLTSFEMLGDERSLVSIAFSCKTFRHYCSNRAFSGWNNVHQLLWNEPQKPILSYNILRARFICLQYSEMKASLKIQGIVISSVAERILDIRKEMVNQLFDKTPPLRINPESFTQWTERLHQWRVLEQEVKFNWMIKEYLLSLSDIEHEDHLQLLRSALINWSCTCPEEQKKTIYSIFKKLFVKEIDPNSGEELDLWKNRSFLGFLRSLDEESLMNVLEESIRHRFKTLTIGSLKLLTEEAIRSYGPNLFTFACEYDNFDALNILMNFTWEIDPEISCDTKGNTFLHKICSLPSHQLSRHEHVALLKTMDKLLSVGFSLTQRNHAGECPLSVAIKYRSHLQLKHMIIYAKSKGITIDPFILFEAHILVLGPLSKSQMTMPKDNRSGRN